MSVSAPLPFGLGESLSCNSAVCNSTVPLPAPGTPVYDQVSKALQIVFSTFYQTSLRYLSVSEILDWLEQNHTIEAWITTGIVQNRSPLEVGNSKNLEVGRGAIRSVIQAALDQEDEAWATSLREVGFSSGMSVAYEGIISQLKSTSLPPCLHTLLSPTGLAILKSAPLKTSVFPSTDRNPSPDHLLKNIKSLIVENNLTGGWTAKWKPQIRKAFAQYHATAKETAEEIISDRNFSKEMYIFLDSISQPLTLYSLIEKDWINEFGNDEFGPGKGLLCTGSIGGQNILEILDFVAAKKPSELLNRLKARDTKKINRAEARRLFDKKRSRIEEIRAVEKILKERTADLEDTAVPLREIISRVGALTAERLILENQVAEEMALASSIAKDRERELREKEEKEREEERLEREEASKYDVIIGPSRDLQYLERTLALYTPDPFSADAPRSESPSTRLKGKGKAATQRRSGTPPITMPLLDSGSNFRNAPVSRSSSLSHSRNSSLSRLQASLANSSLNDRKEGCLACNQHSSNGGAIMNRNHVAVETPSPLSNSTGIDLQEAIRNAAIDDLMGGIVTEPIKRKKKKSIRS